VPERSIRIPPDAERELVELVVVTGQSEVMVVRRAIGIYSTLWNEHNAGYRHLVQRGYGGPPVEWVLSEFRRD
jgi:hypothetical protein